MTSNGPKSGVLWISTASHPGAAAEFSTEELDKMHAEERKHFPLPEGAATVWKYYKHHFFKDLLESRRLYLCQVSRFPDEAEARMNTAQLTSLEKTYGVNPETVADIKSFHELVRQRSWVTCFSVALQEEIHLWRTFCGGSEGVAVRTTFRRLLSAIATDTPLRKEIYPALVRYDETAYLPWKIGYLLFQKLLCFSDEKELRLCVCRPEQHPHTENCRDECIPYPVHLRPLLQQIRVHPKASGEYFQEVKCLVARELPDREKRVRWSDLRRPNP